MAPQKDLKEILEHLDDHCVKIIVLQGGHGSGKTWMARELHDAVNKAEKFRHAIWLPLAKESDFDTLCQMIDCQMHLKPTSEEEQKENDLNNGSREYYEEEKKNRQLSVKQKISKKLQFGVSNGADALNHELTLIFLDNLRGEHVKSVFDKIYKLVDEKHQSVLKFLISSDKTFQGDAVCGVKKEFELALPEKPLYQTVEDTRDSILEHYQLQDTEIHQTGSGENGGNMINFPNDDDVEKNCYWHFRHLFNKHGSIHYNELIAHWMMEGYLGPIHSVKEAYRKGHACLMRMMVRGGDFHILEQKESSSKVALTRRAMVSGTDPRCHGYLGSTSVGLVDVLEDGELHMLEGIVPVDGIIRTLNNDSADGRCLSLFLAENYLNRQVLQCFGNSLKCLAYFNPRSIILPLLLQEVKNLSVLILRGCDFIDEIVAPISDLKLLTVLEISGKSSVESLPEKFFSELTKLRTLNLSGLPIKSLPTSFSELVHLQLLILKGCYRLSNLPSVKIMARLEVIDLNGATCLSKMGAQMLTTPLQILDLSHSHFKNTPKLLDPGMLTLTRMLLRGCSNLRFLSSIKNLSNLQYLDVSGAKQMRELSLENKNELLSLNLSGTALSELPSEFGTLVKLDDLHLSRTGITDFSSLSNLTSLRKLTFQDYFSLTSFPEIKCLTQLEELDFSGCEKVQVLPDLVNIQNLKVLDLSDCKSLDFPRENSLSKLSALQSLDLSRTKFTDVSALSSLTNLEKLSLRGLEVDHLDSLASLTKLKELYINDVRLLKEFKWDFLGHLEHLQILNLSSCSIKSLPSLSKITSLEQLILADCSFLETVPDLNALTKLVDLDLSNTGVNIELFADAPKSLRKLSIKDCDSVQGLFPLNACSELELFDLRGSNVTGFSGKMDEMTNMKSLWCSEKLEITAIPRNGKNGSSDVIFWDKNNLSKPGEVRIKGCEKPSMFAIGNHSFRVHGGTALPWEAYCKQLHFKYSGEDNMIYCFCRDDFVFNNSKSWESLYPTVKLQGMSVEIHGCCSYPEGTESSLQRADNIAVIGSSFINSFSDLRLQDAKVTRVGYFSNCACMKCAVRGKNMDGRSVILPESLVLSNLVNLDSLFVDVDESMEMQSLKNICIDCCPKLQTAINRSQKLVNLESVQIKFCENVEYVFEKGDDSAQVSLEKVTILDLFGLPELKEVGATLPSLQTLRVGQCPRVENLNKLFPSTDLTRNLRVLQIISCDGLVSLFESDDASSPVLRSLQTLHLSDLPRLRTIYGHFPALQKSEVVDCPVLETKVLTGVRGSRIVLEQHPSLNQR